MDGISAITQRIVQIQSDIGSFSPPRTQVAPTAPTASFDHALKQAVADLKPVAGPLAPALALPTLAPPTPAALWTPVAALPPVAAPDSAPASWAPGGIPADLAQYGNGQVPAEQLVAIPGTRHHLWAPAGDAFSELLADAAKDGVSIGVNDAYRSYDSQVDMVARKGLYSQGGLAASPGTSDHGWGIALDLQLDSKAQAWMRANGDKHGFVEETPREPWHWVFRN